VRDPNILSLTQRAIAGAVAVVMRLRVSRATSRQRKREFPLQYGNVETDGEPRREIEIVFRTRAKSVYHRVMI